MGGEGREGRRSEGVGSHLLFSRQFCSRWRWRCCCRKWRGGGGRVDQGLGEAGEKGIRLFIYFTGFWPYGFNYEVICFNLRVGTKMVATNLRFLCLSPRLFGRQSSLKLWMGSIPDIVFNSSISNSKKFQIGFWFGVFRYVIYLKIFKLNTCLGVNLSVFDLNI